MPAAAVIPAPIAYTKVVAVKKLVVGFLVVGLSPLLAECVLRSAAILGVNTSRIKLCGCGNFVIYCEQNRVFKAGLGR